MSTIRPSSRAHHSPPDYLAVVLPGLLILSSVGAAITFSIVASRRPLTALEAVLLQFVTLLLGFVGSFVFGRQSASAAARQMVKPHARSAFRRVLFLYQSLGRLAQAIEKVRPPEPVGQANAPSGLDMLEAIVAEQIWTATDALEDWRDLIPEDVEEVERRIAARQAGGIERVSND